MFIKYIQIAVSILIVVNSLIYFKRKYSKVNDKIFLGYLRIGKISAFGFIFSLAFFVGIESLILAYLSFISAIIWYFKMEWDLCEDTDIAKIKYLLVGLISIVIGVIAITVNYLKEI